MWHCMKSLNSYIIGIIGLMRSSAGLHRRRVLCQEEAQRPTTYLPTAKVSSYSLHFRNAMNILVLPYEVPRVAA